MARNSTNEYNDLYDRNIICLEVPGKVEYRNVVVRAVSIACKLAIPAGHHPGTCGDDLRIALVSAVGEAYNNIASHGYAGRKAGWVQLRIVRRLRRLRVELRDTGASFDPTQVPPPDLASLPESGLGIFVMRAMVDELSYVPGCPNLLILVKYLGGEIESELGPTSNGATEIGQPAIDGQLVHDDRLT